MFLSFLPRTEAAKYNRIRFQRRSGARTLHLRAVWPVGLAGGFLPNIGCSIYLLRRNRTEALFQSICPDVFWAILMASLWMGAFALYGMSATYMGRFGTSIGWRIFQILMIMTATLSGVFTGRWAFSPRLAKGLLGLSIICLGGATTLFAYANG
jgi:hypothetical protein